MYRVGVIIPAGGKGRRMGGQLPKQFLPLFGIPVIQRTVALFEAVRAVHEIVIAAPGEYVHHVRRLMRRAGFAKVSQVVAGGKERQDSVWKGLNAFERKPDIVLVHDAVRPLVEKWIITEVIRKSKKHKAAVVGVRVKDTVKVEQRRGYYAETLQRDKLWTVQTPQGFHFDLLLRAHRAAKRSNFRGTDEGSLVERLRIPVRIVEGNYRNIKITTREDLALAEFLLRIAKSASSK